MSVLKKIGFIALVSFLANCMATVEVHDEVLNAQQFQVTITSLWTAQDHGAKPSNAHFSTLVNASHSNQFVLFRIGQTVTPGFELLAELGQSKTLDKEIDDQIKGTNPIINNRLTLSGGELSQKDITKYQVAVTAGHPYFSFASMIAQSPDWIIGLDSYLLYNTDESTLDLYAISAGTEGADKKANFTIHDNAPDSLGGVTTSLRPYPGFEKPFARIHFKRIK